MFNMYSIYNMFKHENDFIVIFPYMSVKII